MAAVSCESPYSTPLAGVRVAWRAAMSRRQVRRKPGPGPKDCACTRLLGQNTFSMAKAESASESR